MLREWLGETGLERFVAMHLQREPLSYPHTARSAIPFLDWDILDRVIAAEPAPDVLVVQRGVLRSDVRAPRSSAERRALFDTGIALCVRHAERHDAGLASVARAIVTDLPGEAQVQLFANPARSHGFGWHYDAEDVLIAQTLGVKHYYFRANTLDPRPTRGAQPDFSRIREERTPLLTCTLWPGDFLYLPAGYWHVAQAEEACLSISIGLFPSVELLARSGLRAGRAATLGHAQEAPRS